MAVIPGIDKVQTAAILAVLLKRFFNLLKFLYDLYYKTIRAFIFTLVEIKETKLTKPMQLRKFAILLDIWGH